MAVCQRDGLAIFTGGTERAPYMKMTLFMWYLPNYKSQLSSFHWRARDY